MKPHTRFAKKQFPVTHKAFNRAVTPSYLSERALRLERAGYQPPKWIQFCEKLLGGGYILSLYEARTTHSKYITVASPGSPAKPYKVRFSDHKAVYAREANGDCDFFVGMTNLRITNWHDAVEAVHAHFGGDEYKPWFMRP